ncbi:TPA: class I SAM-dependent methyltransferase [Candidatus Woesearchaeota archaeon]|nr:class I SAM-dependent methyltransferase [Candidatus Woesearchaeota archaeon]HIH40999.1 class I SAM-dependent methyltransferase [Candidatus Woesearchaeota archaeon]
MKHKSYYRRFKIIIGTPLWRIYLRSSYKKCLKNLKRLNFSLNFSKKSFSALLCGVGNEATADEFIKFVTGKNKNAKIIIIDIGDEQIRAVRKLVGAKYSPLDIIVKKINALELDSFIKKHSIDWIETDGFLEYFDQRHLRLLFAQWKNVLAEGGVITFRDSFSKNKFDELIGSFRVWIAREWLGVTVFSHSKKFFENLIELSGFNYCAEPTLLPTFIRYTLIKT